MKDCNIKEKSNLYLVKLNPFKISVETQTGKIIEFDVIENQKIVDVKEMIKKTEGVAISQQILSFKGNKLSNYNFLKECNIQKDSRLHLHVNNNSYFIFVK